jgi:glycosyltransferase involved in cell wall biosynthesis
MFEYMSSGIPVIASNFPLWREIIEGNDCGLCVNPDDPKEIGESIQFLVDNPSVALKMGQRGIQAVKDKYNWSVEERKLIRLYLRVLEAF